MRIGLLNKVKDYYNNMMIMRKYFLAFFLLVMIPTVILSVNYFININETLYAEYRNNKESTIQNGMGTVMDQITDLQSINKYFQTSTVLINYLEGIYEYDADIIHYYNNDIDNLFSYVELTNDLVQDMTIYSNSHDILLIPPYLRPMEAFQYQSYTREITPQKGVWVLEQINSSPKLFYFMKFYNENYHRELGVLSIGVDLEGLLGLLDPSIYDHMYLETEGVTMEYDHNGLRVIEEILPDKQKLKNRGIHLAYDLPEHLGRLFVSAKVDVHSNYYQREVIKAILFILLLCVILGGFYFITYYTIVKRLGVFKSHISSMQDERIIPFEDVGAMDEVGFLMLTFNQFAHRINHLIDKVYREEILKKEAMYYALEAQINPHFLYNTLESIRMMAEENCDFEVADQLYLLGSILRYTLSKNQDSTRIDDEISYTEKYLSLFQRRNKHNFVYSISNQIHSKDIIIPKYIIQPLIENAIKHGFATKLNRWEIKIRVEESHSTIRITVWDNGIGMSQDAIEQLNKGLKETIPGEVLHYDSGIGLYNVNDRIKFYGGEETGLRLYLNEVGGLSVQATVIKKNKDVDCLDELP